MENVTRPGGALATRPLYFFWVVDYSGSMVGKKMGTLNQAAQEVVPEMRKSAEENPNAQLYVRRMKFSDTASWIDPAPIKIEDFSWSDIVADGMMTNMGDAFELLAQELTMPPMPQRALPPVIVMLSDGQATDDYKKSLKKLLSLPWGKKSVRVAIAIGGDDADIEALKNFTGNIELVLKAETPTMLVKAIKWASTIAASVSAPASFSTNTTSTVSGNPPPSGNPLPPLLPPLPPPSDDDEDPNNVDIDAEDVF